jgi:hypothetical protein
VPLKARFTPSLDELIYIGENCMAGDKAIT